MDPVTLKDLLAQCGAKYSSSVAFKIKNANGDRSYTYSEVGSIANKIQNHLFVLGLRPKDKIALFSENRPEWSIAYLAITAMGCVCVPLDAMLKPEEISMLLADCGAKAIILSAQYKGQVVGLPQILMEEFDALNLATESLSFEVGLDDLAAIVYTSGTTGLAKGVMLSHRNLMSNVIAAASLFELSPNDTFLSVLPIHHTFETTAGFLGPFYKGCQIVYAESLKSYNLLRNMQENKVTIMCGVPLLYQLFYDGILRAAQEQGKAKIFDILMKVSGFFNEKIGVNIGKVLFSSVHKKFGGAIKFFVSGGAAIDLELLKNYRDLGFNVVQGYGLTESSPILTACTINNNRLGSAGKAIPGVTIKIAGTDAVGEILAFGPNIMQGYYQRPDLTDKVIINGWLYTGDVGYVDEQGFLFITGRSKDVIISASGVNIYPEEIEFWLNKQPAILESCVLGQKILQGIQRGGEEVFALIVPKIEYFQGLKNTQSDFIRKTINDLVFGYNKNAAEFRRIAKFEIRSQELPKTRLKKVKRFEVKKELNIQ